MSGHRESVEVVRVAAYATVLCLALASDPARSTQWELDLDARLVSSDGRPTFSDGGVGTLRYDESQSGLRLGRARLALTQSLGEVWSLRLDASAWGDNDRSPVDLTEAYLQFRPYPRDGWRLRVKAGAFHSPISLENRAAGWESPYTLSYSAINTWLGEELRTIGLEAQVDWLGSRIGHAFDVALTGGVFGWNDPAGVVLATRGFALDDRQTTLFGRIGSSGPDPLGTVELFHEIDGRAGYYAGVETRYFDRVVIRALHYDNRADPAASGEYDQEFAWATHFNAAGLRIEGDHGWTAIAQWLDGQTSVAPDGAPITWPFDARFALLSKEWGRHRLSLRYDAFEVQSRLPDSSGAQRGHAWTAAYVLVPAAHWRLSVEWLRVASDSANRAQLLGQPAFTIETQLQLAVRYSLGTTVR